MKTGPKPGLTRAARAAAKFIGQGDSVHKAMKKAGYSESTSRTSLLTRKPEFQELLQKYGPQLKDAFQVTKDAMVATHKKPQMVGRDDNGHPTYEYVDEEDHDIRLKAAEQTYKLHRVIQSEGASNTHNGDNNQFNIIIDPNSPLAATIREIRPGDLDGSPAVQDDKPAPQGPQDNSLG